MEFIKSKSKKNMLKKEKFMSFFIIFMHHAFSLSFFLLFMVINDKINLHLVFKPYYLLFTIPIYLNFAVIFTYLKQNSQFLIYFLPYIFISSAENGKDPRIMYECAKMLKSQDNHLYYMRGHIGVVKGVCKKNDCVSPSIVNCKKENTACTQD